MDWSRYKLLCDSPWIFTRWMLEQTERLVGDPVLAAKLEAARSQRALQKPPDHRGGAQTDVFPLALTRDEASHVVRAVIDATREGRTTTQGRGLGGFSEAWQEYLEWIEQGGEHMSAENRVMALIEGFNRIDLDAILACFSEDALYHNMPMEAVQGVDAIREVLSGFVGAASEVQWDVLNIVADGGTVLTERVDKFKINGTWVSLPVMGTFEVVDDRITVWRDYFDLAQFQTQFQAAMGGA